MKCKKCDGSGRIVLFSSVENCEHCKGKGNIDICNNIDTNLIKQAENKLQIIFEEITAGLSEECKDKIIWSTGKRFDWLLF
jgi:DnaJ-class molecular chaperone